MKIILKDGSVLNIPDFKIASISYEDNDSVIKADETDFEFEFDKESKTAIVKLVKDRYIAVFKIPSKVQFDDEIYSVTAIGDDAFRRCRRITCIKIPNSVTSIGWEAFAYCPNLTSIVIPNSVTYIGRCAFYGCPSLTSIEIPESVTEIGSYAFDDCTSLTSIVIPNSVTSIGNYAFSSCSRLKKVRVPKGCKLSKYAFPSTCEIEYY